MQKSREMKTLDSYNYIISQAAREEKIGNYYKAESLYKYGLKQAKHNNDEEKIKLFHGLLFSFI